MVEAERKDNRGSMGGELEREAVGVESGKKPWL